MPAFTYSMTARKNLEANQKGQLSDKQREAITTESRSYLKPILWVIGGAGVLMFGIALILTRGNLVGLISAIAAAADASAYALVCLGLLLAFGLMIGLGYFRTRTQARDLAENNIVSAEGAVTWRNRRYIAITDDKRRLKAPLDDWNLNELDLLPGRYRFYYLGRVRWILSAQRLSGELSDLLPPLSWAFGFTQEDLDANRRGELTERQARTLRSDVILGLNNDPFSQFSTIWTVLGLGTLSFIAYVASWSFLTWVILTLLYLLLMLGWRVRRSRSPRQPLSIDLQEKRVEQVDGLKRIIRNQVVRDSKTGRRREVRIRFLYAPKINQHFRPGRRGAGYTALVKTSAIDYRVYYTPRTRFLVALEPISTAQAKNAGDEED